MKKMIVAAVAAASLCGAIAVAALAPIGIASAQDSPPQQEAPDTVERAGPKPRQQRRAAARSRIQQRATSRRGEIAEYLGITPEALKQEMKAGRSLAEIAGPRTEGLVDMLTTKASARIDAALTAGRIDEARATQLEEKAAKVIERLVNAQRPVGATAQPG
jgi:hypothetical protein